MRDVRLGEHFADGLDDVDAVFVDGVVAAVLVVRVGAVVVDGQAAAEVEVAHRGAFLHEADVDAAGLLHAGTDVADVRDLGADVVMEQAEAVEHVLVLQVVDELHELGGVQAEDAAVAAGFGPLAAGARGELHADADHGLDFEHAAAFDDHVEFAGHLDDEDAAVSEHGGEEREVDELLVLVAVADHARLRVVERAEGGDELRLAAGFESVVEIFSETGDVLHDLLLLIDLDGEDAFVLALVFGLFDRLAEARVELVDAGFQDVADADQHGHVHAAFLDAVDDVGQADRRGVLARIRGDRELALVVDVEIPGAPVVDAVKRGGILRRPMFEFIFFDVHSRTLGKPGRSRPENM